MAIHSVDPTLATLHGPFDRDRAPILTVDPGDSIRFRTLDAGWHTDPETVFEPRQRGHALCGPVAVRGARPGMTLTIRIDRLLPGAWGWTASGGWMSPLNQRLGMADGGEYKVRWDLDHIAGTATNQFGHRVALRPFLGVIGMPADVAGEQSTTPPRATGGNLDCRELVEGSTLHLPIGVAGALLSLGDGHGAQGDGEVSGTAIECGMDEALVTIDVHEGGSGSPRAETPAGTITFGFHADLGEAAAIALEAMLDVIVERHDCERREALALCSVAVDLRVTQLVNTIVGVHAVLAPGAIR